MINKSFSKPIYPFGICPCCHLNTYISFSMGKVYCMNCDYEKDFDDYYAYDRHELTMLLNNNIRLNDKYD